LAAALILLLASTDPAGLEPIRYRLPLQEEAPRIIRDCRRAAGDEILVCGRRDGSQRLEELTPPPGAEAKAPGVIGIDLPFGRIEPEMSTTVRSDGHVDKRIMVKLKIPF
jgi:hypothetical protein